MIRRPPRATRTDTRFPYTTLFRSTPSYIVIRKSISFRIISKAHKQPRSTGVGGTTAGSKLRIGFGPPCRQRLDLICAGTGLGLAPPVEVQTKASLCTIDAPKLTRRVPQANPKAYTGGVHKACRGKGQSIKR